MPATRMPQVCSTLRMIFGVLQYSSRQPLPPQAHCGPLQSTLMWPISPQASSSSWRVTTAPPRPKVTPT